MGSSLQGHGIEQRCVVVRMHPQLSIIELPLAAQSAEENFDPPQAKL